MKLSVLGLGLAVVAGSAMVSASAQAATLSFASGGINLVSQQGFEFEFLGPTLGDYKSILFVADSSKNSVQTLFSETAFGNNSPVSPTSNVFSSGNWAASNAMYSLGWSSVAAPNTTMPTVYSTDTDPLQFLQDGGVNASGWYTFKIEDIKGGGDKDYNDGKFRVRAVPVPAIVPGIALAAAFLGSKAIKRNKKNASESIA